MQKNGTGPLPCTQINSRWIENLNVRSETIKLLEEHIVTMFLFITLRDIIGSDSKVMAMKAK